MRSDRPPARPERRFTDDEAEFLKHFAHNYTTGRRLLCFIAHAIVTLGMVAAAIAAIGAGIHTLNWRAVWG